MSIFTQDICLERAINAFIGICNTAQGVIPLFLHTNDIDENQIKRIMNTNIQAINGLSKKLLKSNEDVINEAINYYTNRKKLNQTSIINPLFICFIEMIAKHIYDAILQKIDSTNNLSLNVADYCKILIKNDTLSTFYNDEIINYMVDTIITNGCNTHYGLFYPRSYNNIHSLIEEFENKYFIIKKI
jgi:hypothetical protein